MPPGSDQRRAPAPIPAAAANRRAASQARYWSRDHRAVDCGQSAEGNRCTRRWPSCRGTAAGNTAMAHFIQGVKFSVTSLRTGEWKTAMLGAWARRQHGHDMQPANEIPSYGRRSDRPASSSPSRVLAQTTYRPAVVACVRRAPSARVHGTASAPHELRPYRAFSTV